MQKELSQVCVFYALTPVHAGSGQAIGAVDLPIQRERHTQWPQVQASGVKGAFRDWFYRYYLHNGSDTPEGERQCQQLTERIFGQAEEGEGQEGKAGQAGALAFTDARLLAFPVRSQVAPFVWVTCPAVLTRLQRDLKLTSLGLEVPAGAPQNPDGFVAVRGDFQEKAVILEDLAVTREESTHGEQLAPIFQQLAPQADRLLLISDQRFSFLVRTATEVQAQIAIDPATGTTKTGSLRYQELLPADSVLYTLVFISGERTAKENGRLLPEVIKDCLCRAVSSHLQMGGDLTLGRGLMEVRWLPENSAGGAP